ncbi:hypothetical protein BHM03_00024685 [Ensete ventricosum]|nr:hypothetical protein BHM03_00024685 [Ensete ventricosum]
MTAALLLLPSFPLPQQRSATPPAAASLSLPPFSDDLHLAATAAVDRPSCSSRLLPCIFLYCRRQRLAASSGGITRLSHSRSAAPSSSQTGPTTCAVPVTPTTLLIGAYTSTLAGPPSSTPLPIGKKRPPLSIAATHAPNRSCILPCPVATQSRPLLPPQPSPPCCRCFPPRGRRCRCCRLRQQSSWGPSSTRSAAPSPPAGHPQASPFSTHGNLASPTVVLEQQRWRAPPLCLISIGSDLRPTATSPPSSALLLLP